MDFRSCGFSFTNADVAYWLITMGTMIHYCHDAAADSNGKAQEKVYPVGFGGHIVLPKCCDLLFDVCLAIESRW